MLLGYSGVESSDLVVAGSGERFSVEVHGSLCRLLQAAYSAAHNVGT